MRAKAILNSIDASRKAAIGATGATVIAHSGADANSRVGLRVTW
jgi:hypothetical protein